MKLLAFLMVVVTGILLVISATDFPAWGDVNSAPNQYLSSHYIAEAEHETGVPNIVTAVLADYRSYDTFFETAVVFCAGLGIAGILSRRSRRGSKRKKQRLETREGDLIIQVSTRLLVPVIQIFALYVIAHGHHSPGGGFQGGVILAASLILFSMAYDLPTALDRFSERMALLWGNGGLLIYGGIGLICMGFGAEFLNYSVLHPLMPGTDAIMARSHSMLGVEIGVGFTVMSILFAIYTQLVSNGSLEDGL